VIPSHLICAVIGDMFCLEFMVGKLKYGCIVLGVKEQPYSIKFSSLGSEIIGVSVSYRRHIVLRPASPLSVPYQHHVKQHAEPYQYIHRLSGVFNLLGALFDSSLNILSYGPKRGTGKNERALGAA